MDAQLGFDHALYGNLPDFLYAVCRELGFERALSTRIDPSPAAKI